MSLSVLSGIDYVGLLESRLKRRHLNILFLGGGKRVSLLERFIQAAFEENIDLYFFCYELSEYVHIGHRATVIKGKPFKDFTLSDLDLLCAQYNIDIVIPLMDAAIPTCARYKEIQTHVFVPVPEFETAWVCYDKLAFQEWVKREQIPHYPFPTNYPMFAKSRYGYGSRKQGLIKRKSDLAKLPDDEEYIFQGYLTGDEFTVDCYVDLRGNVLGISPRKRLLVVRGEVENSVTVHNPQLVKQTHHILEGRGFSGPVTVQFMEHEGTYWLTEINARFGGGSILSFEAGADYPSLLLKEYLKKPVQAVKAEPDVLMLRSYRETFYSSWRENG